jgi:hypothetical protein
LRRSLSLLVAAGLAVSVLALAGPAGAQTGDLAAFCAARQEANSAQTKAENAAVIEKVYNAAPAAAVPAITAIRDGFAAKGQKFFDSEAGTTALAQLDSFVYDNCPGTQVPVTAIDYEFSGMPATLSAGATKFKLTNNAPKESHELVVVKLNAAGEKVDPAKIVKLPQGKAQKLIEGQGAAFMFAPPGQSGYSPSELTPGKYLYACFLPQGGKKKGKSHASLGMYGTFTVQ